MEGMMPGSRREREARRSAHLRVAKEALSEVRVPVETGSENGGEINEGASFSYVNGSDPFTTSVRALLSPDTLEKLRAVGIPPS